ncbi:m7GpppX diphosphatase [Folsomia candida]|uniref:m7GpppX diphosphatase n=1 Tax=Folsomia candida TaxID=158441 RepID=UPI000B8F9632|nr:m7GpppX diphosphatase [Folsomia candida]
MNIQKNWLNKNYSSVFIIILTCAINMPNDESVYLVEETAEVYNKIVKPLVNEVTVDLENQPKYQWIFETVERRLPLEKIIYDDPCPINGFIMIPNILWDGSDKNLYLLAIINQRGIKSVRELNETHLPLLKNILSSGSKIIEEKYGLRRSQLRIYFHYQPTYYHLHVHFNPLNYDAPGIMMEKGHLLQEVISNIEKNSSYYQEATLFFRVRRKHELYRRLLKFGYKF